VFMDCILVPCPDMYIHALAPFQYPSNRGLRYLSRFPLLLTMSRRLARRIRTSSGGSYADLRADGTRVMWSCLNAVISEV
jgi:hypothetical protein